MIDFLTSDFVGYGLLALLVIVLGIMAYWLLSGAVNHIRVSRFFAQHQPTVGIVRQYDKTDEKTGVTMTPVFTGKSMHFMPRVTQTLDQYYVLLECRCGAERFHAVYEIPVEDYRQAQVGVSVQVKDHWYPVSYELL